LDPKKPETWTKALTKPLKIQGNYQMSAWPQVIGEPLLVLHFILDTIEAASNPARVVHELLKTWLPGNSLRYEEIRFDFSDEDQIESYDAAIQRLLDTLSQLSEPAIISTAC
jgi:hypothetical protein